jgi:peptidoglycan LD-endopeptidase LytH
MIKKDRSALSRWLIGLFFVIILVAAYFTYPWLRTRVGRMRRLSEWLNDPSMHLDWSVKAGTRCDEAPFILPTNGYVGFIWGDSFRPGHQHQGIDVFGGEIPGKTPVVAAYAGYLSRLPDWKSTVIIRIPSDPLNPGQQIWTYYTHMANKSGASTISPEFPPGTSEQFVEAGTFLGYQGDYSGDPDNPVGVHLHFSIVKDDGSGRFRNELEIDNTLDPSPYLGLSLNANKNPEMVVICADKNASQ